MNKLLNHNQNIELKILFHLISILDKYKISYFLIYGSLLGSVRHGGFIPWDDDIDIGLTVEAEKKFLKIPKNEFSPFFLIDWNSNYGYGLPFFKLVSRNETVDRNKSYESWIDIFTFSNLSNIRLISMVQFFVSKIIRLFILNKCGYQITFKYRLLMVTLFFLKFLSKKQLIKIYNFNATLFFNNHKYVLNFAGTYSFSKEYFEKKHIVNLTQTKFESLSVMVPSAFDFLLRKFYGNYKLIPPDKEKISRHKIT